jgi:hypothetical protein
LDRFERMKGEDQVYAVTIEIGQFGQFGQSKLAQYHLAQNAQRDNREQRKDDADHCVLLYFVLKISCPI